MNAHWPLFTTVLALTACGSVEVPQEQYYRLALPAPSGGGAPRGGALRIGDVRLGADLSGDRLMVAQGPVRMVAYQFHRWAGSLDHLIGDALRVGLGRSGAFSEVLSGMDRGREDWRLSGRVLDFHQSVETDGWHAVVALELRLVDAASGRPVFRREFHARQRAAASDPEAGVIALGGALEAVLSQFLAAADAVGVFDRARARPGK